MRRFTKRLLSLTAAVSLIVGAMSLLAPTKVMANPESINDATIEAPASPIYTGENIEAVSFEIGVCSSKGNKVNLDFCSLLFYSDESCSDESQVASIKNAGVYFVKAQGDGDNYTGITTSPARIKVLKAQIPKPEAVKGLVEDGTEKTGVKLPDGADPNLYVIENEKATNAGTYEATISLNDSKNYCWVGEDNDPEDSDSSKPFNIQWVIEPATPKPDPDPTPTPDPKPLPFKDVEKGKWYYDAIDFVYQNGIMVGKSTDTFDPTADITRQEFVTILYNYMGKPEVSGEFNQFKDVPANVWFSKPVQWGYENKVLNGKSDTEFGLGDVTRQEAAKFMTNFALSQKITLEKKADLATFKDAAKIGKWAKDSVSYMAGYEVMKGKGNGKFDPTAKCSRGEAAQLIKNFIETFRKDS